MKVPTQEFATGQATFYGLLEPADRARIEALGEPVAFAFGEAIVRQSDDADAIFIIQSGHARVVHDSGDGQETVLAMLQPGDVLGEITVLRGGILTATVRASGRVRALRLDRECLEKLVAERPQIGQWLERSSRGRVIFSFLKRVSAFNRCSAPVIWDMIESLSPLSIAKGDRVFTEGDAPGPMYIVEKGRLRVIKARADGGVKNVAFLRDGDFCGEHSLLRDEPRSTSIEAVTPSKLWAIEPGNFKKLTERWPEFKAAVEERIATFDYESEARLPLDFDTEMLPPRRPEQTEQTEETQSGADETSGVEDPAHPFATPDGKFIKKKSKRSFPFVHQADEMDCGAACLAMICRYFGRKVSLARIRTLAHTQTDGTSLGNICHAATELGLAARPAKVSMRNLDRMPLPAILHWKNYHWVVLVDVRKDKVRVADPALGDHWIPRSELEEHWNGFAGLFDFTEAFVSAPEDKQSLAWLASYVRPYLGVLTQALLLALIGSGLMLLLPILTQVVVDSVLVDGAKDRLTLILVAMGATFLFMTASSILQGYMLAFVAVRVDSAAVDYLTRKMLALPLSYFQTRRTGDIQRRLDGARQIRQMVVSSGVSGLLAVVQFSVALGVMALYNPLLTLVYLAVAPFYAILMFFSARVLGPLFDRLEESQGKYRSEQLDSIKGVEAVKACGAEMFFRERLLERFVGAAGEQFRADYTTLAYQSAVQGVGFLTSLLFLWLGAQLTMEGKLSLGGFVAFNALVAMANAPIGSFLALWDDFQLLKVLASRLSDVFEHEPEQGRDRSRLLPVRTLAGQVELRSLGFHYGGKDSTPILQRISLKVPAGQTVAIVGRSGSGKTTMVKLLAGLIEPTDGAVLFDGIDQKTLNYRDLRRQIGFVLQENHMFAGTIAENIAIGDTLDFERVLAAARMANAHEFIERLPLGYETPIGETGVAISGGQRQRVAIARAIYRNPAVLIFDEATSALDTDSERAIQENFKTFFKDRTVFVIAHRLSTIRDADRIVVLEKGEIVEEGDHNELMDRRGIYFYLVSRQVET